MSRFLSLTVIALCAALALTSCSDSEGPLGRSDLPQTPSAQAVIDGNGGFSFEEFFEGEIPNNCLDETVLVSGVIRVRGMSVETGQGSHGSVLFFAQGTGVGQTSGALYVFHNSHVVTFNSNSAGGEKFTEVVNILLVSKGSSANSVFQVKVQFTRNANGEITVDFVKAGCRA